MGRIRNVAGVFALWALCAAVSAGPTADSLRAPRRPVAPPTATADRALDNSSSSDPVVSRIHSLLAGVAIRRSGIDVVPLFARRPSEASGEDPTIPSWHASGLVLRRVAAGVVRVHHDGSAPLLLVPGLFVRVGANEYEVLRVGSVAPGGSVLAPVRESRVAQPRPGDVVYGLLPASTVARALLGETSAVESGTVAARGVRSQATYVQLARDATSWFPRSDSVASVRRNAGTCVGCVTLLGGQVRSAHVFASHVLFRDAWPDILAAAVRGQRAVVRTGVPVATLEQRALRGSPRGRALLALRTLTAEPGRMREIPGGGTRWEVGGRRDGILAQGLVSDSGQVLYVGVYPVPPSPASANANPGKPVIPSSDPEEDPTKRQGGRFNPFGGRSPGSLPGGRPDPLAPPR